MTNELIAEAKLLFCMSFIHIHFHYCSMLHFCGLGDLKEIENVQLRGVPFNDFHASYSDLTSRAEGHYYT